MRALLAAIAIALLAGCASAPSGEMSAVYDRKYNQTSYVSKPAESEFVGTGSMATEPAKPKPAWYLRGHP